MYMVDVECGMYKPVKLARGVVSQSGKATPPLQRGIAVTCLFLVLATLVGCTSLPPPSMNGGSGSLYPVGSGETPNSPNESRNEPPSDVEESIISDLIARVMDKPARPLGQYEVQQDSAFTVDLTQDIKQVGFLLRCLSLDTKWEVRIGNDDNRLSKETCVDVTSVYDIAYFVGEADYGIVDINVTISDSSALYLVIYGVL